MEQRRERSEDSKTRRGGRLDLHLTFSRYVDHLGGDGDDTCDFDESSGYVYVYPSADLGFFKDPRGITLPDGLRVNDLDADYRVCIDGLSELKTSSCIGFSLFARSRYQRQDFEMPCGTFIMNLKDGILDNGGENEHSIDFWETHVDPPILKGSLSVKISCAQRKGDFAFKDASWMSYPPKRSEDNLDVLDDYIKRAMSMFFDGDEDARYQVSPVRYHAFRKYTPNHHSLKTIHVPYYVTGIPDVRLPGFSYSWLELRGELREEYYVNLIRCSLSIFDVREEDFLTEIDRQFRRKDGDTSERFDLYTNVVAAACCLYSQGQLYVPDHVNKHNRSLGIPFDQTYIGSCENMGVVRLTHGNDCEDMGSDNSMVAMALKTYDKWKHPLTVACKRVLGQFMVLMVNCAVSTRSAAENRTPSMRVEDLISHVLCLLVPNSRMVGMCRRTHTDHTLLGLKDDFPAWNRKLNVLFLEGTGRVRPNLKNPWEHSGNTRESYDDMERLRNEFEHRNSAFASYNIMQYTLRPKNEDSYEFSEFYKYMIGAQIPRGQGASVADLSFVYEKRGTYGVSIQHLVYDEIPDSDDPLENDTSPGIVINEILSDHEIRCTSEYLNTCQPIPHLAPRSERNRRADLNFLAESGHKEWNVDMGDSPLGYFFSMRELMERPSIIEFSGHYELYYKYFGLSDDTSYVEICPRMT